VGNVLIYRESVSVRAKIYVCFSIITYFSIIHNHFSKYFTLDYLLYIRFIEILFIYQFFIILPNHISLYLILYYFFIHLHSYISLVYIYTINVVTMKICHF